MAITPRHALVPLALLLAAPGCRSGNDSLSTEMPDAAAGRADTAAADRPMGDSAAPDEPASAVTGKQVGHWLSDQPELANPSNFANAKVSAWVERDGEWKFFPGQGTADGKLSVSDVPAGPFLFRLNENYFAASTERDFDLDFTSLGRPDRPAPKIRPTPLTVALTNLQPWQASDRVDYYAPGAPSAEWGLQRRLTPALGPGASSVVGSGDWGTLTWNTLIDGPGKGDEAWFTQLSSRPSNPGTALLGLTRVFHSRDLKVIDGQPVMVTGAMTEVPQTSAAHVELPVADLDALAATISPAARRGDTYYEVLALPGGERFGEFGAAALLVATLPALPVSLKVDSSYGDPYPPAWIRLGHLVVNYNVPVLIPGATAAVTVNAQIFRRDVASAATGGSFGAEVSPVREPKINGMSAFTDATGVSANPVLSWSGPATGKGPLYMVELLHARVANGKAVFDSIAYLYTADTSIRIPPDVLQFGESYVARILARTGEGITVNRPWMWPAKIAHSQCVTARFSP
jgi:hypothetical protein